MTGSRLILGIDPGSRVTGYGLIAADGGRLSFLDCGVIQTGGGPFPERLWAIFEGISRVIAEAAPNEAAVEQVFVSRNAESALKLGQARGAAICAVVQANLPVSEYAARRVKQAVVGRGGADKRQVRHMVCAMLGLKEAPSEDAGDALAVAVCHAHESETRARMRAMGVEP